MRYGFLFSVLMVFGSVSQASGHAFLLKSSPAVGSEATGSITELRLEFTEPIELVLSGVELTDATGSAVSLSQLGFADSTHRLLTGKVTRLMSGTYRVRWHVVSADTHRTEGSFSFTVKP